MKGKERKEAAVFMDYQFESNQVISYRKERKTVPHADSANKGPILCVMLGEIYWLTSHKQMFYTTHVG